MSAPTQVDFHPAHTFDQFLKGLPEFALFGHSNVGKSSLLNQLLKREVARVSNTPGRTRAIHYYTYNGVKRVVDLPGYGFATGSHKERNAMMTLLDAYLQQAEDLRALLFLFDLERKPTRLDNESFMHLVQMLGACKAQLVLVFTKADRLVLSKRSKQAKDLRAHFQAFIPGGEKKLQTFITSSKDKPGCVDLSKWLFQN